MLDMAGFAEPGVPVIADPGIRRWDQFMELRAAGATVVSASKLGNAQDTIRVNQAAGLPVVQLGSYVGNAAYGGCWQGNVTPSTTNYALISNGTTQTFLNAVTTIFFRLNHGTSSGGALNATGLAIGSETPSARLHVIDNAAGTVCSKFQGAASQTANLMEWQNSATTVLSSVDKDGYHVLPGGLRLLGYVTSVLAPTTSDLPNSKDCAIHKDTALGTVRFAFNDGGTIRSVVLA